MCVKPVKTRNLEFLIWIFKKALHIFLERLSVHKKWIFLLKIPLVNVNRPAVISEFLQIYWRNPQKKTLFFAVSQRLDVSLFVAFRKIGHINTCLKFMYVDCASVFVVNFAGIGPLGRVSHNSPLKKLRFSLPKLVLLPFALFAVVSTFQPTTTSHSTTTGTYISITLHFSNLNCNPVQNCGSKATIIIN